MPPFIMLAARFAIAGALLLGWEVLRGGRSFVWPTRREWRDSAIVGGLLLGVGNGFVAFGEQTVHSGIAAILIALMPVWLAILGWVYFRDRLPRIVTFGVAIGVLGVFLLVWPVGSDPNSFAPIGIAALLISPLGWAHGSLFSARRAHLPSQALTATAAQMLAGSVVLLAEGLVSGELGHVDAAAITTRSIVAFVYLTVVGSMLAFNAYAWLLRHAPLSLVGTYAYVNPVVAVALGAFFLAEEITPRTLLASAIIVAAVAMIVTARGRLGRMAAASTPTGEDPDALIEDGETGDSAPSRSERDRNARPGSRRSSGVSSLAPPRQ